MLSPNTFNIESIRKDFPILSRTVNGHPLVYFDNGATTQKPLSVLKAIENYYTTYNSNVHRGVHYLSQIATDAHEASRKTVQQFINARHDHEIIFTRGTTESINLIAASFAKKFIKKGDEIIISTMEHHSNIVPWQLICEQYEAKLRIIPIENNQALDLDAYRQLFSEKTKIVAITWVSNALGTVNPAKEIIQIAHQHQVPVLLDAAQAIQHHPIDVQDLDVDFLVYSGHKIYAPTGIGVLYGKEELLNQIPPYQGGGSMIKSVSFEKTTYAELPFKFEAGTPYISGSIGLAKALEYVTSLGWANMMKAEESLMEYALSELKKISEVQIIGGTQQKKSGAISFLAKGLHPFDVGEILNLQGIAIRTGHHCCQPLMDWYKIPGTIRASFSFYNTHQEIDQMIRGLKKAITMLS